MVLYVVRRIVAGIVLAILVTFITFFLLSFSFEGAVRTVLGPSATPEAVNGVMRTYGFDRPVIVQYVDWLGAAVHGDFGTSIFTSQPVGPSVFAHLAVTLSLIVPALIISVVVSVVLGVWSASRGGVGDRIAQGVSLIGHIVPPLLLAIVLVVVFAITLKWLPATGFTAITADPAAWARSVTIPVIVLVTAGIASMTAQIRGSMIDELHKDYVRTLRTRGLSTRSIVLKHALRNAASPALTVLSLEFLGMLGGALIIENVFALPGFGSYSFNATLQGDIPVIMGVTFFSVLMVVVVNLLADLANGWLNPKARVR
jgi:peptide/nickel transport system permease protein